MSHETTDLIVACSAAAGVIAAFLGPLLMRSDVKRSMAESWGRISQQVEGNEKRLVRVEETLDQHTADIGFLKGKANGAAASRF